MPQVVNGVSGTMENVANHVEEECDPKGERKKQSTAVKRNVLGHKVTMKNAIRTLAQVNI